MSTTTQDEVILIGRPNYYQRVGKGGVPIGEPIYLPKHAEFMASPLKRLMFIAHRRARKTSKALEKMFQILISNPGIVGQTLAPDLKQARSIIWNNPDMLFKIVPARIIKKINKSELSIELINGSRWTLDGMDNPHSKRGGNVKVLHLTEAGDHEEITWTQIYEPILIENGGVAIFEGNPRGQNWYYDLYNYAVKHPDEWGVWNVDATETGIFTPDELAGLKERLAPAIYAAEYANDWVASEGAVFRVIEGIATAQPSQALPGRHYRFGIDLGKMNDFTVVSIVDRCTWAQAHLARFNMIDWPSQKARIVQLAEAYGAVDNQNEVEIYIEGNGPGSPIFDDLFAYFNEPAVYKKYRVMVADFTTTNKSKDLLVSNFSMLADMGIIQIVSYPVLLDELKKFTYKKNQNTIVYGAPANCHDDCVMATLISYWQLGGKLPLPMLEEPPPRHQWGMKPEVFKEKTGSNNPFINVI